MEEKKVLLSVKDLSVKFRVRGRILTAIRNVSLDLYENESIAIVGESGSGKSVFTKTFAGMLETNGFISEGQLIYSDDELADTVVAIGSAEKRRIKSIWKKLDEHSKLEHGAEIYKQIVALEDENRARSMLTDEESATENERGLVKAEKKKGAKRPSMSRATSFSLSLKNLFTKKGRTILTSFAGSIGIIGIALILAVSQGMTAYIDHVQESTLSVYPLTLEQTTIDLSEMLEGFMNAGKGDDHELDAVYKDSVIGDLVDAFSKLETNENDLEAFKLFLEEELADENSELSQAISGIQYTYSLSPTVYTKNLEGDIIKSDSNELMMEMLAKFMIKVSGNEEDSSTSSSSPMSSMTSSSMASMMFSTQMWQELLPSLDGKSPINPLLKEQYDVIHGDWPNEADEIVLVVNENNELDDLTLYSLGLLSREEIDMIVDKASKGEPLNAESQKWSYEEICGLSFKVVFPYDCYQKIGDTFMDISQVSGAGGMEKLYNDAMELRVVGIIRPSEDTDAHMLSGAIGYTNMLTQHIITEAENSEVVKAQLANPNIDVLTGLPFKSATGVLSNEEKTEEFKAYVTGLSTAKKAEVFFKIQCLDAEADQLDAIVDSMIAQMPTDKDSLIEMIAEGFAEQLSAGTSAEEVKEYLADLTVEELMDIMRPGLEEQAKTMIAGQVEMGLSQLFPTPEARAMALDAAIAAYTDEQCALYYDEISEFSKSTYEDNLVLIGALDLDSPAAINLYASSFENKDIIVDTIASYNDSVDESKKIAYTDFLGIMMSSITTIINAITYVLIAFVAISLIVSSIMIGVITLISVQERTKEIGILRAIGASKRDVSSLFNAETLIIGFSSGMLGVIVTYLLCIPINLILHALTGIPTLSAYLPFGAAVILVAISMLLTLFSGIIPSRSAAKKDPVVALRTE